jgi:anti-anti-sigma factor
MPVTATATPLGTPLVRLVGDFDVNDVVEVETALGEAFENDAAALIIDLSSVGFLDSMMLRQIAHARERAQQAERKLVLVRPDPIIWRVFTITGMAEIIASFASVDEADEHLAKPVG